MRDYIAFILLFISTISFGQTEKILQFNKIDRESLNYGFYLGLHSKGYAIKATNATITNGAGFHVGVLADLKINNFTSLITEPGLISSNNSLIFDGETTLMPTTYFHLPVSIKLSTKRLNNVRGFIIGGVSYNYNFTANKNNNDNGTNPRDFKLKQNTLMGELGIGASFYFPFFRFSPSIRGVYGFQNEFVGLGETAKNSLSELKTRGIFLNLIFQ